MTENAFLWLLNWYQNHCDGDWEHRNGVDIDTMDNPGWSVIINLQDTELENKKFHEIKIHRNENDWLFCFIKEDRFEGRCGPLNASEVLQIFQNWAENIKK